jgi:hypothetical protein
MQGNEHIEFGTVISSGAAINLDFEAGVPDHIEVYNLMAAAGEVFKVDWFSNMGDAKEIQYKALADNGSTGGLTLDYVSSGGYISERDADAIAASTGTTRHQGVTIGADFSDDNDVIYYKAFFNCQFKNRGDEGA